MINKFKISAPEIVVLTPISEDRAVGVLNSSGASQPRNCNSIPSSDKSFYFLQNVDIVNVSHPTGLLNPIWASFSGIKRPERESHGYTPSSAQVMSAAITPTHMLSYRTDNFTFRKTTRIYNSLY
jgi:hypothetical protein